MPPRTRKPRQNPLIPVDDKPFASSEVASAPEPMLIDSPICGQCWPDGWAALGDGDYASCVHGDWSTNEGLVRRAAVELAGLVDDGTGPYVIDGVTTDGTPVKVTIRPGGVALVSLARPAKAMTEVNADFVATVTATGPEHYWPESESAPTPAPSPFAPVVGSTSHPSGATLIQPEELDAGEDVMFMPSGE